MANYLAVDSGGTKVLAILYDEAFRPKAISRVGSFRTNTTSPELVRHNMEQMQKELGLTPGTVIDQISGVVYQDFLDFLKQTCTVKNVLHISELETGLHAACIFGDGINALSGTGSNIGVIYQGKDYSAGGYGAAVADSGSGYWMAREAMNAAIADFEGFGEQTLLTKLIAEYFGYTADDLRTAIFSIYSNTELSPVAQVASCAPLVSQAASAGDQVAIDILKRAGEILGKQATALVSKNHFPDDMPLTISGSVWRSNRILFDSFAACIRSQSPNRPIKLPEFEPILGVMARHCIELTGDFNDADRARFKELYPQYQFSLPYTVTAN